MLHLLSKQAAKVLVRLSKNQVLVPDIVNNL